MVGNDVFGKAYQEFGGVPKPIVARLERKPIPRENKTPAPSEEVHRFTPEEVEMEEEIPTFSAKDVGLEEYSDTPDSKHLSSKDSLQRAGVPVREVVPLVPEAANEFQQVISRIDELEKRITFLQNDLNSHALDKKDLETRLRQELEHLKTKLALPELPDLELTDGGRLEVKQEYEASKGLKDELDEFEEYVHKSGKNRDLSDLELSNDGKTLRMKDFNEPEIQLGPETATVNIPKDKVSIRDRTAPSTKGEYLLDIEDLEDVTRTTSTEKAREAMQVELNRLGEEMGIIVDRDARIAKTESLKREAESLEMELQIAKREAQEKKQALANAKAGERKNLISSLAISEGKVKRLENEYPDKEAEFFNFATLPTAEDEILDRLTGLQEERAGTKNASRQKGIDKDIYTLRRMQSLLKDAETWVNPIEAENNRRAESRRKATESWKRHLDAERNRDKAALASAREDWRRGAAQAAKEAQIKDEELSIRSEEESNEIRRSDDLEKAKASWLSKNASKKETDFADAIAQQELKGAKRNWEKSLEQTPPSRDTDREMSENGRETADIDFDIDVDTEENLPPPVTTERRLSPLERQMGSRPAFYDIPPEKKLPSSKKDIPTTIQTQNEQDKEKDNQRLATYQAQKMEEAKKRMENIAFYRRRLTGYHDEIKHVANELAKYGNIVEVPGETAPQEARKTGFLASIWNKVSNGKKIVELQGKYEVLMERYQETEDIMKAVERNVRAYGRPILGQGAGSNITNEAPSDQGFLRERNEQEAYQRLSEELKHLDNLYRDLPTILLTGSRMDGLSLENGQEQKIAQTLTRDAAAITGKINGSPLRKIERVTLSRKIKDLDPLLPAISALSGANLKAIYKQELPLSTKDDLRSLRASMERSLGLLEAKSQSSTSSIEQRKAANTLDTLRKIVGGKSTEDMLERIILTLEAAARLPYANIDPIPKEKLTEDYNNKLRMIQTEIGNSPKIRQAIEKFIQ